MLNKLFPDFVVTPCLCPDGDRRSHYGILKQSFVRFFAKKALTKAQSTQRVSKKANLCAIFALESREMNYESQKRLVGWGCPIGNSFANLSCPDLIGASQDRP